jgi:long-chain acyl-CoA synthetase
MTFVHSRFYNALRVWLDHGNPLVIASDWHPRRIAPLLARTRPGYLETHPNTFIEWEDLDDDPCAPLSSVRYFGGTFDAMHPRTIQRLLAASRRPHPLFIQLYGQSETGPVTARLFTRRGAARPDARDIGRPLAGFVRLRVVGPDRQPVPRGVSGHLEVRLRSRVLTYLGEQDRYDGQLDDGWWGLGDMGFRDRWGRVHLLDREVDRIEAMPSNLETEDLLLSRLPELREVAIVAGPGGEPVPVVCTRDEQPLDIDRWKGATNDLPQMAPPVLFPFDAVPRTSTWKVRRPDLVRLLKEMAR